MRRFHLDRTVDVSGVSGTGRVAEGIQFHDGQCVMKWLTNWASLGIYSSADELIEIHGHDGSTSVIWDDAETTDTTELLLIARSAS